MVSFKWVALIFATLLSFLTLPFCFFTSWRLALYLSSHEIPLKVHWEYEDEDTLWWPLLVDWSLLWLFIGQHSLMALPCWKDFMERHGLHSLHRVLYIFCTSVTLQAIMEKWEPLPATPMWLIDTSDRPFTWTLFFLVHLFCWIIICLTFLTMDFPEMIGIKQLWYDVNGWQDPLHYKSPAARKLYRHMRHPGAGCLLVVLWVHPVMSLGRFFLAASWTLYLLCGFQVHVQDHVYMERQVTHNRISVTRTIEIAE